jgi:hypothetical protein
MKMKVPRNGNTAPASDWNVLLVKTLIIHLAEENSLYFVKMSIMRSNSPGDYLYKPYVAILYKYDLLSLGSPFSPFRSGIPCYY